MTSSQTYLSQLFRTSALSPAINYLSRINIKDTDVDTELPFFLRYRTLYKSTKYFTSKEQLTQQEKTEANTCFFNCLYVSLLGYNKPSNLTFKNIAVLSKQLSAMFFAAHDPFINPNLSVVNQVKAFKETYLKLGITLDHPHVGYTVTLEYKNKYATIFYYRDASWMTIYNILINMFDAEDFDMNLGSHFGGDSVMLPFTNEDDITEDQDIKERKERENIFSQTDHQKWGNMPGDFYEFITPHEESSVVNWQDLLNQSVFDSLGGSGDFAYRPKRHDTNSDIAMDPRLITQVPKKLICLLDTSGSISTEDLQDCLGEIKSFIDSTIKAKFMFLMVDTQRQGEVITKESHETFDISDILSQGVLGRGGTSFVKAFNEVDIILEENNLREGYVVLFFTDLGCRLPDPPSFADKLFWVTVNTQIIPYYGTTIQVKT